MEEMYHKGEPKIKLGKPVIPPELAGRNICYTLLRTPHHPAYPNGEEFRYSDDYTRRLNELYSTEKILGQRIEVIASSQIGDILRFLGNVPLIDGEADLEVLVEILIHSAQGKSWQPYIVDVTMLSNTQMRTAKEFLEVSKGILAVKKSGFALSCEHNNHAIVIPTQEFVEYCFSRK